MAYDARHRFDNQIAKLQAKLDAESDPMLQDALFDTLTFLMDERATDLQNMDPKERFQDIWQQRFDDDTQDLY